MYYTSSSIFCKIPTMKKFSKDAVKSYYDQMTRSYLNIYGDMIQAFRPKRAKDLMNYIAQSSGLKWRMHILDAGCGVCGPAIYFARNFNATVDAITVSPIQAAEANKKILQENVQQLINVMEGDYHHLSDYYNSDTYDAVYFLESLGHSDNPKKAILESYKVLKKGGFIYIKDFYAKKTDDSAVQDKINKVIQNINNAYSYNTLDLEDTIKALRQVGFEILYIKRPEFKDNINVRYQFEKVNGIDVFEGMEEFYPAEWLEIKCVK